MTDPAEFHMLVSKVLGYRLCLGLPSSLNPSVTNLGYLPKYLKSENWPGSKIRSAKCRKIIKKRTGKEKHICQECSLARKRLNLVLKKREKVDPGAKLAQQLPSSRVKMSNP